MLNAIKAQNCGSITKYKSYLQHKALWFLKQQMKEEFLQWKALKNKASRFSIKKVTSSFLLKQPFIVFKILGKKALEILGEKEVKTQQ